MLAHNPQIVLCATAGGKASALGGGGRGGSPLVWLPHPNQARQRQREAPAKAHQSVLGRKASQSKNQMKQGLLIMQILGPLHIYNLGILVDNLCILVNSPRQPSLTPVRVLMVQRQSTNGLDPKDLGLSQPWSLLPELSKLPDTRPTRSRYSQKEKEKKEKDFEEFQGQTSLANATCYMSPGGLYNTQKQIKGADLVLPKRSRKLLCIITARNISQT